MTGPQHDPVEPGYVVHSWHATGRDGPAVAPEEPLDAKLAVLADRVVSDLQHDGELDIRLAQRPPRQPAPRVVIVTIDGTKYGFGVDPESSPTELILSLAEGIQEHLAESSVAWGQARPRCPWHPHPLEPRIVAGRACWVCPRDQTDVAEIGEYRP